MIETKGLGWLPDDEDDRDLAFEAPQVQGISAGVAPALPKMVDFRKLKVAGEPKLPPVFDQGKMGSCTGQAVAGAIGFLRPEAYRSSRLFIYYVARVRGGNAGTDNGATIRNAIKGAATEGAPNEQLWKYLTSNLFKKPSLPAYADAKNRVIGAYRSITSLNDMKAALALDKPVVFGFTVFSSFHGKEVATTGNLPMPTTKDKQGGGHAVVAVGYDDEKQVLIVRNSWGPKWGAAGAYTNERGYFYMPYAYFPLTSARWTFDA